MANSIINAAAAGSALNILGLRNISMDFFRGIMAIFVAVGHFYSWNKYHEIPLSFVLSVDFFLVLSGFVIGHSVLRQGEDFDSITFAKNRWMRLFPVYAVCVAATLPLAVWLKQLHGFTLFDMFRIVTISQMIPLNPRSAFPLIEPVGIAYTISAELWVGIFVFPVFALLAATCRNLIFPVFMLLILWAFILLNNEPGNHFMNIHHWLYGQFLDYGIIRCIFDYSIGILAYFMVIRLRKRPKAWLCSTGQIICLAAFIIIYCKFHYVRNNEFLAPFLFALFIIMLSFKRGIIYRLTANHLGIFLGNISYPLYLIHPLGILLTQWLRLTDIGLTAIFPLYLAFCICAAWLLHHFIERPCLKLIQKSQPHT